MEREVQTRILRISYSHNSDIEADIIFYSRCNSREIIKNLTRYLFNMYVEIIRR